MAITYTASAQLTDGANSDVRTLTAQITGGDHEQAGTVSTSTDEGSVAIDSDITGGNGPHLVWVRNMSSTAAEIISLGTATGVLPVSLGPGEVQMFGIAAAATALFHDAASGTPLMKFKITERPTPPP